jgi:hypothetical protein
MLTRRDAEIAGCVRAAGPSAPLQALKRALAEQAFRSDVPVLHFGEKRRLDPHGFRLPDRFCELRFRTDDRVELLSDLARYLAGPTGAHLAHVPELFTLSLSQIKGRDAGRILRIR